MTLADEKKGITVKIDADLHAEVREYIDQHGMTMAEFITLAVDNELHPKYQNKEEKNIKAKYQAAFNVLKAPYAEAVLESVPAHLKKVKEYELQFVFHADGWFLVHCITALLKNGKLKEPTEGQKKSLTTLIANV